MILRDHTPIDEARSLGKEADNLRQQIEDIENTIIRLADNENEVPPRLLGFRDELHERLLRMERRRYSLELAIRRGDIDTTIH